MTRKHNNHAMATDKSVAGLPKDLKRRCLHDETPVGVEGAMPLHQVIT